MADVNKTLKDALYVTVGLGVLSIKAARTRREELRKQVSTQLAGTGDQLQKLAKQVEGRIEPVITQIQDRLPKDASGLVNRARTAAKDAQDTVQSRIRRTAA